MPLYLCFVAAAPVSILWREELFWGFVAAVKRRWHTVYARTHVDIQYPMAYCVGIQSLSPCKCHVTVVVCLTFLDLRMSAINEATKIMRAFFKTFFYHHGKVPRWRWFKLYRNDWCKDPNLTVGNYIVASGALPLMLGWARSTGLRFSTFTYSDEALWSHRRRDRRLARRREKLENKVSG